MFYFLSKLFSFLLDPLVWMTGLFVLSFLMKKKTPRKIFFALGCLFFLVFTHEPLYNEVLRKWTSPVTKEPSMDRVYDCALILGGFGSYEPESGRIQFDKDADRFWHACWLYRRGIVRKILISGDATILPDGQIDPREKFLVWARQMGIPREDLLLETASRNSYEHTRFIPPVLEAADLRMEHSLLVTSAVHMPRALAAFHKAGLNPIPCAVKLPGPTRIKIHNVAPSSRTLSEWSGLWHEWAGLQIYRWMGYAL